jgi:hypothetical protein
MVPAAIEQQEGRGICDEKVGFACSLTDRAGPSPLFSRLESPSAPRGAGDGLDSPDGLRAYSRGKGGTGGAARPNNAARMKKMTAGGALSSSRMEDGGMCTRMALEIGGYAKQYMVQILRIVYNTW